MTTGLFRLKEQLLFGHLRTINSQTNNMLVNKELRGKLRDWWMIGSMEHNLIASALTPDTDLVDDSDWLRSENWGQQ